ncbi:hypothetical protein KTU01_30620 [Kocuria turfanensis]|uniref:Polymer-forming cytoskeletal protein n=1 Tax=Kocuria turfanensis TaxID=388357 RepID=A0A512IGU1_9MICC|nr:hypothetical protein KTU01_30620 [Kocuria turfanensis]
MIQVPARRRRSILMVLVLTGLLLTGLLLTGCSTPAETGRYSATLITQRHHVVEDGDILIGDTVVAGGTVVLEDGAEHRGSVTVLDGGARIGGRIAGDLTVLGGTAALTGTGEITGDIVVAGGSLTRDPGRWCGGASPRRPTRRRPSSAAGNPVRSPNERGGSCSGWPPWQASPVWPRAWPPARCTAPRARPRASRWSARRWVLWR